MSVQPQRVVPAIGVHASPLGQTPPHSGALLCEQSTMMSTQLQWFVESGRQSMFVGQTPPHCGAVACAHGVGGCLQIQGAPGVF